MSLITFLEVDWYPCTLIGPYDLEHDVAGRVRQHKMNERNLLLDLDANN
jgi:hypothetical protein